MGGVGKGETGYHGVLEGALDKRSDSGYDLGGWEGEE